MPILPSAKKKLRQDKKRTAINKRYKTHLKKSLRTAKEKKTASVVNKAYQALDRAAKRGIVHKKKASRLKSRLSKLTKK